MNDLFNAAKTVPPAKIAEAYGAKLVRKNGHLTSRCLLHEEATPSCDYWDDHFYCFGCHAHGSSIDLMMQLKGISAREAAERICKENGILYDDAPIDRRELARKQQNAQAKQVAESVLKSAGDLLIGYRKFLESKLAKTGKELEHINADTTLSEADERMIEAQFDAVAEQANLQQVDYEFFTTDDTEEKLKAFKTTAGEAVLKAIKENTRA